MCKDKDVLRPRTKSRTDARDGSSTNATTKASTSGTAKSSKVQQGKVLNREVADALCTAIVLGFCLEKNENHEVFRFEYDGGSGDHQSVCNYLAKLGANIAIGSTTPKSTFPLIVGRCPVASSLNQAEIVAEVEKKTAVKMESKFNVLNAFGAYAGGYSTVSSLHLLGVSALDVYQAKYREVDSEAVRVAYQKACRVTCEVNEWLSEFSKLRTGGQKTDEVKIQIPGNFRPPKRLPDNLFKSYHGMIRAMVTYHSDVERKKSGMFFEIALGPDTNKVASCFPCCTFMTAFGHPPTSTHLGRGDNWNIPPGCPPAERQKWEGKIRDWWRRGHNSLPRDVKELLSRVKSEGGSNAEHTPAMFLEALTFEDSFTKRITRTLKHSSKR